MKIAKISKKLIKNKENLRSCHRQKELKHTVVPKMRILEKEQKISKNQGKLNQV